MGGVAGEMMSWEKLDSNVELERGRWTRIATQIARLSIAVKLVRISVRLKRIELCEFSCVVCSSDKSTKITVCRRINAFFPRGG